MMSQYIHTNQKLNNIPMLDTKIDNSFTKNYNSSLLNLNIENISNSDFEELRDFIYKHCGIFISENKKYLLESRIKKRIQANYLRNIGEYLRLIKSINNRNEINQLLDLVTINETYFFRAENHLEALENEIIKEIIANKGTINQFFNIWSAASSTGEEAYSIAMLISEKIQPQFPNIKFRILGTDLNSQVIETAKKGIYNNYAIKRLPSNYIKKYFTIQDGKYHIKDEIKRMVRFVQLNLFDENEVKKMTFFDIIFCANVLIYFDNSSKEKVVSSLYNSLNKGGYFFIGCSESLHNITKNFKIVHFYKAIAYKKE